MKLLHLIQLNFKLGLAPRIGVALCASILLVSCGGGGNGGETGTQVQPQGGRIDFPGMAAYGLNGQDPDEALAPWLVTVNLFRSARSESGLGNAKISTLRYNETSTMQRHLDHYNGQWDADTCTIEDDSSDGGSGTPPYVSGGESVVFNTPAGTWYTINANSDLRYIVENELPGALPANTTLSIPGDTFPTVAAYPLLQPQPAIRISPGIETTVDINSEYRWMPDGDPGTSMVIVFGEYDANGDYIGFADLSCQVEDDGEFALPADALNFVTSSQNSLRVRYDRLLRRMDYVDGIAFFQISKVTD